MLVAPLGRLVVVVSEISETPQRGCGQLVVV